MTGFETLTHARIRAAQGDRSGARRIARAILARDPQDRAARDLLEALGSAEDAPAPEADDPTPDLAVPASAEDLRDAFRSRLGAGAPRDPRARLAAWLEHVRNNRRRRP